MKRFQQNIRKVVPYVPGDQPDFPDMIKLNTNENPYPPAPEVQEVLAKSNAEQMRLYPDPTAHQLNAAIAEAYGVEEAQVFTGVGSDDVLAMIFQTFFNSDLPILPYLLSFAAGAMIYVVVEELIPEMSEAPHSNVGTIFFAVGFALMMTLDVALG